MPIAHVTELQALGSDAEYVVLKAAPKKNSLDFLIAYYVGLLSAQEPSAFFHIISKDSGFDPLIEHLKGKGIKVRRSARIAEIPHFKSGSPPAAAAQVGAAIAQLVRLGVSKPRTRKALLGTLNALFKKELSEEQLSVLLTGLCKRGVVKIEGTKVSYELPAAP
jgi:hypothetical protein